MSDRVIAVTGASGFVGRHLCRALGDAGWRVRAVVRSAATAPDWAAEVRESGSLENAPDWESLLEGAKIVVHCAGVAHTGFADEELARETFERVNRRAAVELGRAAVAAKVHRLLFVSSIGVYGPLRGGLPADESMACSPSEPYALSKLAAERELVAMCDGTDTELVVLRPPLVYGPCCPGNFARLVGLVRRGLPLPFGRIGGRRHFVSIHNLAEFVVTVCDHEDDAAGIFNVADAREVGLSEIVVAIGEGLGRPARLLRVPPAWLRAGSRLVGKQAVLDKLAESITIDTTRARERFGWNATVDSLDGMRAAAASFVSGDRP